MFTCPNGRCSSERPCSPRLFAELCISIWYGNSTPTSLQVDRLRITFGSNHYRTLLAPNCLPDCSRSPRAVQGRDQRFKPFDHEPKPGTLRKLIFRYRDDPTPLTIPFCDFFSMHSRHASFFAVVI